MQSLIIRTDIFERQVSLSSSELVFQLFLILSWCIFWVLKLGYNLILSVFTALFLLYLRRKPVLNLTSKKKVTINYRWLTKTKCAKCFNVYNLKYLILCTLTHAILTEKTLIKNWENSEELGIYHCGAVLSFTYFLLKEMSSRV